MAVLTDARNALWDAIDNWPAFSGVFKRKYKFDGDDSPEINPTPAQLPAIAIYPDPSTHKLVLHRRHENPYKLICLIFTETWNLETADQYWQDLIEAAWQSAAAGVPYVKAATGFYPDSTVSVDHEPTVIDGVKVTITSVGITLTVRYDPQG